MFLHVHVPQILGSILMLESLVPGWPENNIHYITGVHYTGVPGQSEEAGPILRQTIETVADGATWC